jgi:putative peptide zinc metalloprotease protein
MEPPMATGGERFWFIVYTIASFVYRMFIYTAIILFIATRFFLIGVLFACWGLTNMFIWPAMKGIKFLLSSPRLRRRRIQATLVTAVALAGIAALIILLPAPLATTSEGVIWIPEKCFVRAGTDGFVERLLAPPRTRVGKGDPLIECSDPLLPAEIKVLESQLRELEAVYDTQIIADRVKAEITKEEIRNVQAQLDDARERASHLKIRSGTSGTFVVPMAQDLPGRFIRRGELVGYVLDRSTITARVVVSQSDVDFVRHRTKGVKLRFPENICQSLPAILRREVPAATDQLPGRALSQEGGGEIAIDPRDMQGVKAFQKIFLFDVELPTYEGLYNVGGRVYVRFDHGKEPVFWRWYRGLRKLFLRRFNV